MKLPFWIMPGSWGLKGTTYKVAKAEYELEGEKLDRELLRIRYDLPEDFDPETYEYPKGYVREFLDLDRKHGIISEQEYNLELASLEERPFVQVASSGFDPEDGPGGFWMEFSWNSNFIDFLREHEYTGIVEQEIFDKWLSDIYRSQVLESELGEMENMTPETETEVIVTERPRPDGKIEYT